MSYIVEVSGQTFNLSPYECSPSDKEFPFYINITGQCNGRCQFCSNAELNPNETSNLDLPKLRTILRQTYPHISRFSVSGGEPLINPQKFEGLLDLLSEYNRRITINTNGSFLKDNIDLLNKYIIESIQLSRHHYLDMKNNQVFGTKTLSIDDLPFVKNELNADLRINCVLMKNYIDNSSKVTKFLESVSDSHISEVGFISMMQVNQYTRQNFIDYRDLGPLDRDNSDFFLTRHMVDGDRCTCDNYAYIPQNGIPIFVYLRYTEKYHTRGRSLFFDDTGLKEGY